MMNFVSINNDEFCNKMMNKNEYNWFTDGFCNKMMNKNEQNGFTDGFEG